MSNAKTLQTVNMITFGGGYSLPAWVARNGLFSNTALSQHHAHAEFGV
jgi:hypothetical protein